MIRSLGIGQGILLAMVFIIIAFTVSGCAGTQPYAKIGIYKDINSDWSACTSENSSFELGLEHRISEQIVLASHYEHLSHITCGFPFNNKQLDDSINQYGVTMKVGGV